MKLTDINKLKDAQAYTAEDIKEHQEFEAFLAYLDKACEKENERLKNAKLISVKDLGADYF